MTQTDMFKSGPKGDPPIGEWTDLPWFKTGGFTKMEAKLEALHGEFYPHHADVYHAFVITPFDKVKVVILGQDPYHGPGQAHGLAFSVKPPTPPPPSLRNVFEELKQDKGCVNPSSGDLTTWARQGVLLLNTILTVAPGQPMSHADLGWQDLTGQALRMLVKHRDRMVFMLWGNQAKQTLYEAIPPAEQWMLHRHLILHSAHPSPRSAPRGFFGSKPFSTANDWLNANKIAPIWWCLP
jgi:uracil-DNA glycosylase